MQRLLTLVLVLVLALGLASCGAGGENGQTGNGPDAATDPEYPVVVGGTTIAFRPTRIVSLAPSITEKIYDLGHGGRLVGISYYQGDYPASLAHMPAFGLATRPNIQGILSVNPHLVFSVSELPLPAMAALEEAGIPLVILPSYAQSMSELEAIYLNLSMILDGRTTGRIFGESFRRELNRRIDEIAAEISYYPPLNAVYLRALDFTVATGDTLEGQLMERLGFVNIARDQRNWAFDPEEAVSPEGRELFGSLDVIFFDPGDQDDPYGTSGVAIGQSTFWQDINAAHVYIDNSIFEIQSMRLLGQLELMAQEKQRQFYEE